MASQPGTDAAGHDRLDNPEVAYEHSDVNVRAVLWFIATLVIVTALTQVSMWGLFRFFDAQEARSDPFVSPLAAPAGELPPEPRLQTTPWTDLKVFRAEEERELHTSGWVDQSGGIAHIPIDRAKAILLQRGIPARASDSDPAEGTHVAASGEATGGRNLLTGGPDRSGAPAATPSPEPAKGPGGAGEL